MILIKCMSECSYPIHVMPFGTTLASYPTLWYARHACIMTLTLHLIMSLHNNARGPIKPVHCACEHDVCSLICDPNSKVWAQLSSATRYVKKFFDLLNPPRHGSHGRLEEDEKVCLQTSPQSYPPRLERSSFSKSYHLLKTKPQIFKTTI